MARVTTIFAIVLALIATIFSILALLGGLDAAVVRDMPWVSGTIGKGAITLGSIRIGLWQACMTSGDIWKCTDLASVSGVLGKFTMSDDELKWHRIHAESLPYTQLLSCIGNGLTFVAAFVTVQVSMVVATLAAMVQIASVVSAAVFFMNYEASLEAASKIPFSAGFYTAVAGTVAIVASLALFVAARIVQKRKEEFY